jgi:hypothetical protein
MEVIDAGMSIDETRALKQPQLSMPQAGIVVWLLEASGRERQSLDHDSQDAPRAASGRIRCGW